MVEIDYLFVGSTSFLITVLTLIILRVIKLYFDEKRARDRKEVLRVMVANEPETRNEREAVVVGGRRMPAVRRRVRHVEDMSEPVDAASDQEDEELLLAEAIDEQQQHIGKKKLAKLQAKEERRKQREAELLEREERKKREQEKEERLQMERQKQQQEEEAELERKRLEREEREKREEEEYRKLRETFVVDEEGFDQADEDESQNLLRDFEEYVRKTKVVNVDELGAHFNLRTEDAVDRLNYLVTNGSLTGVMDDRGKFIHITAEELEAVAKFINQRGRVSKSELMEYSNKLINLESRYSEKASKLTVS